MLCVVPNALATNDDAPSCASIATHQVMGTLLHVIDEAADALRRQRACPRRFIGVKLAAWYSRRSFAWISNRFR
jgi:hypothetical protein